MSTSTPLNAYKHAHHPSIPTHIPSINPTELDLSPSKARAHATTAQSWAQVTSWLSRLYRNSASNSTAAPPQFERDDATLAYLQSLMHANLAADTARRTEHEARIAMVGEYEDVAQEREGDEGRALLRELEKALSVEAREMLGVLARTCVLLGIVASQVPENHDLGHRIGIRIAERTAELFELEQWVDELDVLRSSLEAQHESLRKAQPEQDGAEGEPDEALADLRTQTSQFTAQTKHLGLKLAEYNDRIAALRQSDDKYSSTFDEAKRKKHDLEVLKDDIGRLERKLKSFNGLPPDVEASREEVRRAQAELDSWKKKREELFENT
jgi:HAUS augmin-like complex subunit 1